MRRWVLVAVALTALGAVSLAGAVSAQDGGDGENGDGGVQTDTVETVGKNDFKANSIVFSTLAFQPGDIEVSEGQQVQFTYSQYDVSQEPHTVTVVDEEDIPDTFDEIFFCEPCQEALQAHSEGQPPEAMEESAAPPQSTGEAGEEGIDAVGDSLWMNPGETVEATVSASPGTTLSYVCAIHPWMQGTITMGEGESEGN